MRTIKQVSDLTGVSVRMLHYYDQIELLCPTKTTAAGYRLYDDAALETLQQILFFKELQVPLKEMKQILDSPNYDKLQTLQRQKKPGTLLCLHGQLKTASWALLDRLAKGGAVFWYSGDFDPEGLLIAQRLRQRYENVQLWHFSAVEYQRTQIPLPANRLKRLQGICDLELKPIVMKMQEWKCAYYQESFADLLLKDL